MDALTQAYHTQARVLGPAPFVALVLLAIAGIFFVAADHGFLNGNESIYVESAREMLRGGSLIIPTVNGLPYLEKPPLFQWLLLAAFQIGGVTEVAARSVPLIATAGLCFALARFSSLLGLGGTPWTAAYVYVTSVGVVVMSSVALPDMLFNSLFAIGCLAFAAALQTRSKNLVRLAASSLGLACLAKGFLSLILFALILAAYLAVKREDRKLVIDLWRDPVAWVLLTAPWLTWVAAAEMTLPGTARWFIINEHVLRFLGLREPKDYYSGSVFYYVPRLFLWAFPWVGILASGWAAARRDATAQLRDARHFLWACVWVPFFFFSISQAKANYYITLCLPPLALLEAYYLHDLLRRKKIAWLIHSIIVPSLILVAAVALYKWGATTGRMSWLLRQDGSLAMATATLMALCLILAVLVRLSWPKAAVLGIGILVVPLTFQFHRTVAVAGPQISAREMANYITSRFRDSPLFLYQDYEALGSLPIYLNRNIPVIDSHSNDLYFGSKLRPNDPLLVKERAVPITENALIVVIDDREISFRRSALWDRAEALRRFGNATLYQLAPRGASQSRRRS